MCTSLESARTLPPTTPAHTYTHTHTHTQECGRKGVHVIIGDYYIMSYLPQTSGACTLLQPLWSALIRQNINCSRRLTKLFQRQQRKPQKTHWPSGIIRDEGDTDPSWATLPPPMLVTRSLNKEGKHTSCATTDMDDQPTMHQDQSHQKFSTDPQLIKTFSVTLNSETYIHRQGHCTTLFPSQT